MINDYITNRLADLKSDREQLQFWLSKVNKEINKLQNNKFQYPNVRFTCFDIEQKKEINMALEVRDNEQELIVGKIAVQKYYENIDKELKQNLINDMKELLYKEVGKQFLEKAIEELEDARSNQEV